ncbi:sensor histidine kinase [Bacillus sp. M6-12]|nr:sensor histidine kinase [Bacillus sp. M6-12]
MVSLFLATIVSSILYEKKIEKLIDDTLIGNGKKIIHAYHSTPSAQLAPFMQNYSGISGTLIQLYNSDGKPILDEKTFPIEIDQTYIKQVLANDIARESGDTGIKGRLPVAGIPFKVNGEAYALFLTVEHNSTDMEMMEQMHVLILFTVFFGCLLILIAARYIVNPLLRLTDATKIMANGEFGVEITTKRKDEIGVLTASFNNMAKQLAKLDQMRQDFVSNVSHEIQSPLTSILGFTKALKQKKISEESRLHYLTIIEKESERLSRLSQNLLKLSVLQNEHEPLNVSKYRLDEQIRRVVIHLEPQWAEKEIEIDLKLEEMTIQADEDQLSQVWTNLLSNSIKFTPAHGRIRIRTEMKGNLITVFITDSGPGIPEEEREAVFKPFHKVDKSRDPSVKGNGLGLSIVKKIVEIHNGEIKVSGEPGEGAAFVVKLPN